MLFYSNKKLYKNSKSAPPKLQSLLAAVRMDLEGGSSSVKKRRPGLPLLSVTPPSLSTSTCSGAEGQRSRGSSLGSVKMFLQQVQHSPTASLLHLPTFATPGGGADTGTGRRFSFSLRRFSSQVNRVCLPACLKCVCAAPDSRPRAPNPFFRFHSHILCFN